MYNIGHITTVKRHVENACMIVSFHQEESFGTIKLA